MIGLLIAADVLAMVVFLKINFYGFKKIDENKLSKITLITGGTKSGKSGANIWKKM